MGFNFGAFAGGLAEGLQRGARLNQEREEAKLKKKMLDHQAKLHDFQMQKFQQELDTAAQAEQLNQSIAGQYRQSVQPYGAPLQPGAEGPQHPDAQAMSPEQLATFQAFSQGKAPPASLTPKDPTTLEGLAVKKYLANQPDQAKAILEMKPSTGAGEKQLTSGELQSIYGMDKAQADRIATLPAKTQEKTLDNLRADQTSKRQEANQLRLGEQFQTAELRRRDEFREAERRNQERFQLESDKRSMPPLSGKEHTELASINRTLGELLEAQKILDETKGSLTGPIDTRKQDLLNYINMADPRYNRLTTILGNIRNKVRHGDFGSALSAHEIQESLRALVEERQPDALVRERLAYLIDKFRSEQSSLEKRKSFWAERGSGATTAPAGSADGSSASAASPGGVTVEQAKELIKKYGSKEAAIAAMQNQGAVKIKPGSEY